MKKRILSLLLALVMLVGLLPASVLAANQEPPSVTAYFSLTDDDKYVVGDNAGGGSQRVLAYQKVTVPYFDLALYGLEDYYFRSETYTPGESTSGSTDEPYGQITLLHLFIYELERDFCGLAEDQCGKGYLKEKNLIGTDVFNVSGSSGSFFMQNIWNHDLNLLYYVNYQFPIASEGYGSTADQILLREGDVVSMSLYTDWSFYSDDAAGFHHLGTPTNMVQGPIEAKSDETLNLTLYRSSAAMGDKEHQTACGNLDVYYTRADSAPSGDVTQWDSCGTTDENGAISIDLKKLGVTAGDYIFSVAGQANSSKVVVSCPGGTRVSVKSSGETPTETNYLRNVEFASEYDVDEGEDYTFDMSPKFSPDVHDYTILIPDTEYSFYPFLTFRSDVPDDFAATFQFEDLDGEEQTVPYDTAEKDGDYYDTYWDYNVIDNNCYGTTLKLTVPVGSGSEVYTFTVKRLPTLLRNTVRLTSSMDSDATVYGVTGFNNTVYSGYTAAIPYDGAYLSYTPFAAKPAYTVKVNGEEFASGTKLDAAKLWQGEAGSRHFDLTITVQNEDAGTATTAYTVACTELPTGLRITQNPKKTVYAIGESFDPTGMVVSVQYEGGSVDIPHEDLTITPQTFQNANENTVVTVSYGGLSANLTVSVRTLALTKGTGTQEDPYILDSAADLKTLSALVGAGDSYAGKYFKITSDITLPAGWTPIGGPKAGKTWTPTINKKDMNLFSGYMDGAKADGFGCYTITIPAGGKTILGGIEHASLSNLNIYGEKIDGYGVVEYYSNIGYGNSPSITITNVTLKSGSHTKYAGFIGGYASGSNDVILRNCTVEEGVIIGDDGTFPEWREELKASFPYPYGPDSVQYTDMIGSFGGAMSGTIENCVSHAKVYGRRYVGGIMGFKGQSMGDCIIRNCIFDGEVHATGSFAGGILGGGYSASSAPNTPAATVENCVVTGSVTGETYVGGIFGGEEQLKQCWNNGIGYIRSNYFTGTVQATGTDGVAGGIIGYMHSLDCYNVITNNYYLAGSATSGIGKVNSANVDTAAGTQYGRTDDPLGADAEKLASAFQPSDLTDGTLVSKLNAAGTGKAWAQGASAPVLSGEKRVVRLKSTTLNSMNASTFRQATGYDAFSGKKVTVTYSDGSTEEITAADCALSGIDFTKTGYQLASLFYKGYQLCFGVNVTAGGTAAANPKTAVKVSVLGDTIHDVTEDSIHSYANDDLIPWLTDLTVLVDSDATALDVFDRACAAYGLGYSARSSADGSKAISSVTALSGLTLTDQSNKQSDGESYSRWLYSVDGAAPLATIDKEKVSASLLVYFTDDYTFDSVPVITAAIDALSSSPTEEAISSIDAQLKTLSPVALASISNLELLAQSRDMLAVNKAAAAIDAIGDVTLSSGSTIAAAREAYEALTDDQKNLVPNCQLEALMDAEIRYEILVAASAAAPAAAKPAKAPKADSVKALPFTDVASDCWYYGSVKFAYENGLMVGTGANEFSPNADTTRGMVVTFLARMEGVNTSGGSVWYEAGRQWAMENSISDGTNMEDVITREQLVTMLCRYAKLKGCDVSDLASLSGYTDASSVSDWALQSMQWAVSVGLIAGRSAATLAPQGTATRAETATVLMRFAQNVAK